MKKIYLFFLFMLCGCQPIKIPESFTYEEIQTSSYKLASWQKLTDIQSPIHIYIEGDGYAFNHLGYPTTNPTPRGTFLRKIAFNDPNPNVIYLARPCQYVEDHLCTVKDWTTGRFSQKILDSTTEAIRNISKRRPIILIGYSGGALLTGLVINQNPELPIKKWITLAGVLNHNLWTKSLNLPPLSDSLDLEKLPKVNQIHLIGDKDKIVSYKITESLVNKKDLFLIQNATHNKGFQNYYSFIYD